MNLLLILSSRVVQYDIQEIFGRIPPALIELEGKTVLDILEKEEFDKKIVTVYEEKHLVIDYLKRKRIKIDYFELSEIRDIGYTIYSVLDSLRHELDIISNLTICYGDTLLDDMNMSETFGKDAIFFQKTKEASRWTTLESLESKVKFLDKRNSQESQREHNTVIGLFNITNPSALLNLLSIHVEEDSPLEDTFYKSLELYSQTNKIVFIERNDWIDLGHVDNYFKNKRDVDSRYFNTITIDKRKGILRKESSDKTKFINEINWFVNLPKELKYLTPRIFEYSTNDISPYILMEYYAYNTLHSSFVYGNYSIDYWNGVFDSLFEINYEFGNYKTSDSKEKLKSNLYRIYYTKTVERLNLLKEDNNFINFFDSDIYINGILYPSLNCLINKLDEVLACFNLYDIEELTIIHGDYFFANILYDNRFKIVRLIDPRGDFGGTGIYGDSRYDIAKLSHSVDGKYDFIVEDLFELKIIGNEINYEIFSKPVHNEIVEMFYNKISEKYNANEIKLIQALLFLSMVPLHKDKPNRQIVMLATGIKLFWSIEKEML